MCDSTMDSGILMIQDSILVCSPDPRIPHTAPKSHVLQMYSGHCIMTWIFSSVKKNERNITVLILAVAL
jgi:hypothetical protein